MLNSKDFCTLYSAFYGEQIDCLEQLKHAVFDGHELFEFIKYVEQNLANGIQASEATAILPLVTNRYLFWFEHEGKDGWTFEIEADNYEEAYNKAYDTHGPQVNDMMYQLL